MHLISLCEKRIEVEMFAEAHVEIHAGIVLSFSANQSNDGEKWVINPRHLDFVLSGGIVGLLLVGLWLEFSDKMPYTCKRTGTGKVGYVSRRI